ncbi:hypothetical protein [Hydrogenophaga crassostreae]|nr:hypothetical protein [Hydrogenophaga crassostreae]
MEKRLGGVPWLLAPLASTPQRLAALEKAASHAATRFASVGLRAPRLTRRDGVYPLYFVRDLGSAAAQYGYGYGEFGVIEALRYQKNEWDRVMIVGEADGFGKDQGIYPEKVAVSVAHELFHAVQDSYANWSGHDNSQLHEEKWVTEALPDAIGLWAIEGLSFMGNSPFDPQQRFASGSRRFGKVLGMRPYDYPLDLRTPPPSMPIFPAGSTEDDMREMASYMTNSFWGYAWQQSMPKGSEWKPMRHALMLRTPRRGTSSVREDSLAWTDRSLKENHPAWKRGLYDALPAFLPWWVAYPDDVMHSRKGEFAHTRWLKHAFVDGCPLYELDDAHPTATIKVAMRELAGACARVKWTGTPVGKSGWPAMALVVVSADGGGDAALQDFHLGMHGTSLGKSDPYLDPASKLLSLGWSGLTLDPRKPASTDGETVITFSNVPLDPLYAKRRTYDIYLGVGRSDTSGQLDKPAERGGRPASSARVSPRRHVMPGQVIAVPDGRTLTMAVVPSPIAGKDDCLNATAKSAGVVALGTDAGGASNLMSICLDVATNATRKSLNPVRQPDVKLVLPAVPDGHSGPVRGGQVIATWEDPGLGKRGDQHVDARTKDVDINITLANPAFVRGSFVARFKAPSDTVNGQLSGSFTVWRATTNQRMPLADPLDYVSSDLIQMYTAMGKDPAEIGAKMGRRNASRQSKPSSNSASQVDEICPMDCKAMREGKASPDCLKLMDSLYAACPKGEGESVTRDEVASLAAWMFHTMPEPMRSEMSSGTVDTVMKMPSAMRESWASKLRAARDAESK